MDNSTEKPPNPTDTSKRSLLALTIPIIVLLAAGAAFFIWSNWPGVTGETVSPTAPGVQSVPTATSTPTDQAQTPGTPATTTAPTASSTSGLPANATSTTTGADNHNLGETIRLFQGDSINILDKKSFPAYFIKAMNFTDSRCPKNVQCIWAGERGIELQATLEGTEALPRQITLSETTRRTAQVPGLKMTLVEIGDEKGGTYADIKFEEAEPGL